MKYTNQSLKARERDELGRQVEALLREVKQLEVPPIDRTPYISQ